MTATDRARHELSLPQYLAVLAAFPAPAEALGALLAGPLARFGAIAGYLWIEQDGVLESIATVGTDEALDALYLRIPLNADLPAPATYLASEVIIVDLPQPAGQFTALAAHSAAWDGFTPDGRFASLLHAPVVSRGLSLGVVGVACAEHVSLDTLDIAFLDGLGSALGMWLTHPSTPLEVRPHAPHGTEAIGTLTERQVHVLQQVLAGRSNAAIASRLGCSVSTVKQDVQRAQRALHAADRISAAERAWELGLLGEEGA